MGGGNFRNFLVERNILVRNFADFINVNPQLSNILYINISKRSWLHLQYSRPDSSKIRGICEL